MPRQTRSERRVELPRIFPLERLIEKTKVEDVAEAVSKEFRAIFPLGNEISGKKIALTAVSRQVANYLELFRFVIAELIGRGAEVVVVPAVGSHGGETSQGKLDVLANYGITESSIGVPINARVDTTLIDTVDGVEANCVNSVLEDVDGVFLFGRVRRHWDIRWTVGLAESLDCFPLESGIAKLFLGLSMLEAKKLHEHGEKLGWAIQKAARRLLLERRVNVVGALAVVDNEEEETAIVRGLPFSIDHGNSGVDRFFASEYEILKRSHRFLPYLPFANEDCDLLYLHYFGKPYAGQGADTKIIGRNGGIRNWCANTPRFKDICASRLIGNRNNKDAPGLFNAMGVGNLDMITSRFDELINVEETKLNAMTAGCAGGAVVAKVFENDLAMIEHAAMKIAHLRKLKLMLAVSTVWMEGIYLDESYFERAKYLEGFKIIGEPREIPFTEDGFLDLPTFEHI